MSIATASIMVSVVDPVACVKVAGRANFTLSVDFKALVHGLHERGFRLFLLDLTDCLIMDSTFLGVLSGFAMKLGEPLAGKPPPIQLLNPNDRVRGLIENLGVDQFFRIRTGENPFAPEFVPAVVPGEHTKSEVSRTCLEAHETLMLLNPKNVPKFKDVAKFLAEDLKQARTKP